MFYSISWQAYWTTLSLCIAGYYLIVYLVYFRKDFSTIFIKTESVRAKLHPHVRSSPEDQLPGSSLQNNEQETIVHSCIDEVNAYFEEARKSKCLKEEIAYALKGILKKYPTLKHSGFRASLSSLIITQCEHICSIQLKSEDMARVWSAE